jgi:hypothetical protein
MKDIKTLFYAHSKIVNGYLYSLLFNFAKYSGA